jgi:hypothetical protein
VVFQSSVSGSFSIKAYISDCKTLLGFTRVQAGVFLHTDDRWSLAWFNSDDLHCVERELFS